MHVSSHRLFTVCLGLLLSLTVAAPLAAQGNQRGETDVSYVPDDAFFVMLARPSQMLEKYRDEVDAPVDLMLKASREGGGLDIKNLDAFMFVIGFDEAAHAEAAAAPDGPRLREENWFSGVMRFHQPPEQDKIVEKMFMGAEPAEHEGKAYFKSKSEYTPSAWFPDEQTLVFANDARLKTIMEKPAMGMGGLRHHLRRSDPKADAALAVSMDTGKAWFKAVIPEDEVPAPMRPILALPTHLDVAVITGDLSRDEPAKMLALAVDEKSAKYLKSVAEEFQKTLRDMHAANREEIIRSAPSQRVGQLAVDVSDKILSGISLEQEGRIIRGSLKAEDGLVAAAELFVESLAESYRMSQRWERRSEVRKIGQAMNGYHEEHGRFPPAASYSKDGKPLLSWRVHLLPYLDGGEELYEKLELDQPWDSEHNKKLLDQMPAVYAFDRQAGGTHTRLLAVVGENTAMRAKKSVKREAITDATDETVVAVEVGAAHAVPWTQPAELSAAEEDLAKLKTADDESHFLVLTAAGNTEQIKKSKITADALQAFFTIAGGEEKQIFEYSY